MESQSVADPQSKECSIRRYSSSEEGSENASGADNQQGSLRDPSTTVRRTSHWDGETV